MCDGCGVTVTLNFKGIPNSSYPTCMAKAPATGGKIKPVHTELFGLTISMWHSSYFNGAMWLSVRFSRVLVPKITAASSMILNRYPEFESTNNYECMNKSYHLKETKFPDTNSSLSRVLGHQDSETNAYFLTLSIQKKKKKEIK